MDRRRLGLGNINMYMKGNGRLRGRLVYIHYISDGSYSYLGASGKALILVLVHI